RTDAVHTAVALHRFVDAQFDYSQLTGFHLVRFTFGQMHVGIQGRKGAEFEEGVEVANGPAQFDDALDHMAAEGSSNLRPRDLQLGLPDFGVQLLDTMGELAGLDGRNPLVMHEFIEPILFLVHLALARWCGHASLPSLFFASSLSVSLWAARAAAWAMRWYLPR